MWRYLSAFDLYLKKPVIWAWKAFTQSQFPLMPECGNVVSQHVNHQCSHIKIKSTRERHAQHCLIVLFFVFFFVLHGAVGCLC